ncbi:DNA-binding protein [Thiohalocapsa halophila]|uniref:DNA-binding protein n=1 Tax=Thiohalocapsa halophila TaxID=69359 RepID=A0ABS1CPA8_9GAMM|nr:DNA-binding protein [Thiohalocapsa halophila]
MQKPSRALASARLLLEAADTDGACNRAYYAMFDAARAALASETSPEAARTHNGLIAAFGLRLVKTGRLPKELGRMLNRAEEVRLLADYTGGVVERQDASELLSQAETFVGAVRGYLEGTGAARDA